MVRRAVLPDVVGRLSRDVNGAPGLYPEGGNVVGNTGAVAVPDPQAAAVLEQLASLRQHRQDGRRSPHKPLLVLLALGRLAGTGSSRLPWSEAEEKLADLIQEFGPTSKTPRAQSAAYPFTRLTRDGIWTLDRDVPMDSVSPLREGRDRPAGGITRDGAARPT